MQTRSQLNQDDWLSSAPPRSQPQAESRLVLHLDTFEGPLDVLLELARAQKVDLAKISILALVEQYLTFVEDVQNHNLELAADYLVMAAWLAYLKSRLLLPKSDDEEEPSAEVLAARLQLRLQRLEAMRDVGARLFTRARMGRDIFARGAPEPVVRVSKPEFDVSLLELMQAYGDMVIRTTVTDLKIERRPVFSLEEALDRLNSLVGGHYSWAGLEAFLPRGTLRGKASASAADVKAYRKSALASMFAASLELAKLGKLEVRQMETFGTLYLRATDERAHGAERAQAGNEPSLR